MCFHPEKCIVIRVPGKRQFHQTSCTLHGHTLDVVDSGKYLGVTINKDLTWTKHINQTIGKASKTLDFRRRNLGRCTTKTKATAYTTLVRPVLEYASPEWEPHQTTTTRDIEQVQRRAARFAYSCYQDNSPGCVTNLLSSLQWESLQQRRWKQTLVMCYKIHHQLIAIEPANYYTAGDSRIRGNHRLRQIRAKKDTYQHSFFPISIREWNRVPSSVVDAGSLEDFKVRLNSIPWPSSQHR
jgi:hypothetical protein